MEWKKVIRNIEDQQRSTQLVCLHGPELPGNAELRALSEALKELKNYCGPKFREVLILTSRAQYIRKHQHEGLFFQQRYQASYKDQGETVGQRLKMQTQFNPSARLTTWIEAFELEELYEKPLIQLSSGEWQRYSICEALLMKPPILIIPELLKGLDNRWQQRILNLLKENISTEGLVVFTADLPVLHPAVHNLPISNGHSNKKSILRTNLPDTIIQKFTTYQKKFLSGPKDKILLKMDGVRIRYGSKTILEDIHWTVAAGEKWNIQGANGAGKSTLISLVNSDNPQGYSQPISLFDAPYGKTSIWDRKARIAYYGSDFFQYFNSAKTIEQVLYQQLRTPYLDTIQPPETLIRDLMNWFGLWKDRLIPYPVASREVKRQVLLLATYLKSSDILVLDEPYQDFRQERIRLNNQFLENTQVHSMQTVIFVTHRADHKPAFLSRILKLDKGRISI